MDVLFIFDREKLTVEEVIRKLAADLEHSGFDDESKWREARLVVGEALNLTPLAVLNERFTPLAQFSLKSRKRLENFYQRRVKGEPLSRLRTQRAFWKSHFFISPHTLDPRPETEGLIEHACHFFKDRPRPRTILDLGTGTGCLLLSLLQEFVDASGIGVDISLEALTIAEKNAHTLDLSTRCLFQQGSWLTEIQGSFDLIVTNPPYIPSTEIPLLEPEVRDFDPLLALDGGEDGLQAYRMLIPQVARHLSPAGLFLLECGLSQAAILRPLLENYFPHVTFHPDLAGVMRYGLASFVSRSGASLLTS